jgi:hypothetical protein
LQDLQLTYPNDSESQKLSDLACVDNTPVFSSHLRSVILDAHLNDAILRGLSIPKVRGALDTVVESCRELRGAVAAIDVGSGGSAERSVALFEMELGSGSSKGQQMLIPDCLEFLDRVKDAANKATERIPNLEETLNKVTERCGELRKALAAIDVGTGGSAERAGFLFEMEVGGDSSEGQQTDCLKFLDRVKDAAIRARERAQSKRGPKGTTGSPAFGPFIEALQMAARQRRGDWTIYRSADQSWTGSLLEAVMILKPHLPKNFLPRGEVGRAIEHIRKKLTDHITKNLPSSE